MTADKRDVSKICLFVGNIPYSTTDIELEKAFKVYGPLRACYTVKDKGSGSDKKCRGFAYVTFINREDALKAKSKVKILGGRPVQLSFSKRKSLNASRESEKEANGVEEVEEEDDYETLTARKGQIKKPHTSKSERGPPKFDVGRIVVIRNLPLEATETRIRRKCERFGLVEDVTYPVSPDEQHIAHVTFDSHGAARLAIKELNNTRYKKKCDQIIGAVLLSKGHKTISAKTLKKSRLIVRNLSFKCSEEEVKHIFSEYGAVSDVHTPRKENGYMRGFCFVQYSSYFSASNAMTALNGKEINGRKITVDWVVPKLVYQGMAERKEEVVDEEGVRESVLGVTDEEDLESEGQKERKEEAKDVHIADDLDEDSCAEDEEDSDGDSENESFVDDEVRGTRMMKLGRMRQDLDEGKTVFIRNLPLDAEAMAVKKLLLKYGLVRYCRLMVNRDTGVNTGSAFVQFLSAAAAQKCLQAAELAGGGVIFKGKLLHVDIALPPSELAKKSDKKVKEDKRNLYLAKEGVILESSEAAKDISKLDLAKRMKAYSEKKAKLANLHYFVSTTRLCVRNLPTRVDERRAKALFQRHAGDDPDAKVLQVKIMRSSERVDSKGIGRSKGYGFVEFSSHEAALNAVRAINNNPDLFGKLKRPIVEFAVEDGRMIRLRAMRKAREETLQTSATVGGSSSPSIAPAQKVLSKRQKWQQKWQRRRKRRRETNSLERTEGSSEIKEQNIDAPGRDVKFRGLKRSATITMPPAKATKRAKPYVAETKHIGGALFPVTGKRINKKSKSIGRRAYTDKEEENFVKIVERYKRKLRI